MKEQKDERRKLVKRNLIGLSIAVAVGVALGVMQDAGMVSGIAVDIAMGGCVAGAAVSVSHLDGALLAPLRAASDR